MAKRVDANELLEKMDQLDFKYDRFYLAKRVDILGRTERVATVEYGGIGICCSANTIVDVVFLMFDLASDMFDEKEEQS